MGDVEKKETSVEDTNSAPADSNDAQAAKKQRLEEPQAATAATQDTGIPLADGPETAGDDAKPASAPFKIGYKSFESGSDCYKYFHNLISRVRKNQNLNDYEFHMVKELVRLGHPDAERKLGGGLRAVQVRETDVHGSRTSCFFLIHDDWKAEDMSYRKCVANLFPDMADLTAHYGNKPVQKSGGRGRGRGRR